MKLVKALSIILLIMISLLFIAFYVKADVLSVNSGGGGGIVVNPNKYISGFFGQTNTSNATTPSSNATTPGTVTPTANIVVTPTSMNVSLAVNTNVKRTISIENSGSAGTTLAISQTNLTGLVLLSNNTVTVNAGEIKNVSVTFIAPNETGTYIGKIFVGNTPINIIFTVTKVSLLFDSKISVLNKNSVVLQGNQLNTKVTIIPMGGGNVRTDVTLKYQIKSPNGTVYQTKSETMLVTSIKTIDRSFDTATLPPGSYIIGLQLIYPNGVAPSSAPFKLISKNYAAKLIDNVILILIIGIIVIAILIVIVSIIRTQKKYSKRKPTRRGFGY